MSVWMSLKLTTQEGAWPKLKEFLDDKLPAVRRFAGARSVEIFFDEDQNNLMIFEEWTSKEAHQAYIEVITKNGVLDELMGFMQSAPDISYYHRQPL